MTDKFTELLEAHLLMQLGCYFDGTERHESGITYAWSEKIEDAAWNLGFALSCQLDTSRVKWVRDTARAKNRTPCVLVSNEADLLTSGFEFSEAEKERWMIAELAENRTTETTLEIREYVTAAAPSEFLTVFKKLFSDENINSHFAKYYIPALQQATVSKGVRCTHLVGFTQHKPVSTATIYVCEGLAGLYNVGTEIQSQKNGFGREISIRAMNIARSQGAKHIFLQCEADTHVELLYKEVGFEIYQSPVGVTLVDANA